MNNIPLLRYGENRPAPLGSSPLAFGLGTATPFARIHYNKKPPPKYGEGFVSFFIICASVGVAGGQIGIGNWNSLLSQN